MKNNRGIAPLIVILIVAGILALSGGGYYAVKKYKTPIVQPGIAKNQTSTQSAQEIAGWKTYTNSQYGYQIDYPQTASVSAMENAVYPGLDVTIKDNDNFQMTVSTRSSEKTLQQYLAEYDSRSISAGDAKELNVGGLQAFQRKEIALGPGWDNIVTYLKKDDAVVAFVLSGRYEYDDKSIVLYNQILSTFKITK